MPYTMQSENLPSYVSKLPSDIKAGWIGIFNEIYKSRGEEAAFIAANAWLKRKVKVDSLTGNTNKAYVIETLHFDIGEGQLVKNSDGEDYVDFVLTDTKVIRNGDQYPESLLMKWLEQINKGMFVGDIDHEEYNKIAAQASTARQAAELIKNSKKGIAKSLKAIYENGKLWVRALIDKRYRQTVQKSKGVSLEAIVKRDASGKIHDGDLLGFTFVVNGEPVNPRSTLA